MHTLTVFILVTLSVIAFMALLWIIFQFYLAKMKKMKGLKENKRACTKVQRDIWIRNHTSYFWSDSSRFVWISMFMIFFIILGIVVDHPVGYVFAIIISFLFLFFLWLAQTSYVQFPQKAQAQLDDFEKVITSSIEKEISFNGDNIQSFSHADKEFDTTPKIFSFPIEVTKIAYPIFEENPAKHTIISTRKLEFLVLSREYLSICKGATKFNLLDPPKADLPKKCAEIKGAGECHEFYYSLIKNVKYEDDAIKIIFHNDDDDALFPCKKGSANIKPAMKALHEKLRLTERQRLKKIEEQQNYEILKDKREHNNKKEEEK
ncbi:hypothetical protein KKC13_09370 [bacterium]|nr:hypothetical protein [bacterium]MBU1957829.1 hypothetical protein [bacterium]